MMKKLVSVLLAMMMTFSAVPVVYGASNEMTAAADALYQKGLFNGKGTDANGNPIYDLDAAPTRHEAVTMLVSLLGKTEEAKAGKWNMPFQDVAAWAKPYVGYAYANGLVSGTSATTFGGNETVSATQYLTYVLRSLGYKAGVDFKWNKAWELSDKIGLTDGRYNEKTKQFTRGDVAWISYRSLSCEEKAEFPFDIPKETEAQKEDYRKTVRTLNLKKTVEEISADSLTWDQARALVGKDFATVKKYVKTLKDCMLYMSASGFTADQRGDIEYAGRGIPWHFNASPEVVFERGMGDCGGTAGLVVSLLEGDYEEVGFVGMSARVWQGGHVVNYIKADGVYYVMDMVGFAGSRGVLLHKGETLDEAAKEFLDFGENRNFVVAYTYTTKEYGDAPIGWKGVPTNYLIEGYADNIHIVLETPEEGYVYEFVEVSDEVLKNIISRKMAP